MIVSGFEMFGPQIWSAQLSVGVGSLNSQDQSGPLRARLKYFDYNQHILKFVLISYKSKRFSCFEILTFVPRTLVQILLSFSRILPNTYFFVPRFSITHPFCFFPWAK